jgi:hypothetical protein
MTCGDIMPGIGGIIGCGIIPISMGVGNSGDIDGITTMIVVAFVLLSPTATGLQHAPSQQLDFLQLHSPFLQQQSPPVAQSHLFDLQHLPALQQSSSLQHFPSLQQSWDSQQSLGAEHFAFLQQTGKA